MPLTEDDNVIEALSTDGSNQTFDISVLPRRASGGRAIPNAHCSEASFEYLAVGGVTVTDEIRGRRFSGKCLRDLARNPLRCRMARDPHMDEKSLVMTQYDEPE